MIWESNFLARSMAYRVELTEWEDPSTGLSIFLNSMMPPLSIRPSGPDKLFLVLRICTTFIFHPTIFSIRVFCSKEKDFSFSSFARAVVLIMLRSLRTWQEPLAVSCERTVIAGGGLVRYAGMPPVYCTVAPPLQHTHKNRPAQDIGPGTGHSQGRHCSRYIPGKDRKKPVQLGQTSRLLSSCLKKMDAGNIIFTLVADKLLSRIPHERCLYQSVYKCLHRCI